MMNLVAALLAALLLAGPAALAQSWGPPPVCQDVSGQHLNWTGTAWVCGKSAAPASSGIAAIAGGPGIQITGCPSACVVTSVFPVETKPASYPLAPADSAHGLVYNAATPGTFTFPPVATAGFGPGWGVCVGVRGAGTLTLATSAPSAFYGGPVILTKGQSECVTADDAGNWWLFTGVAPALANPNPFQ